MRILIICEGGHSGPIYRWGSWVSRRVKYLQAYLILVRFALLHFIDFWGFCCCCCGCYRLMVCGNLVWNKLISTIFPTVFSHFVSVSHFHNSHNNSNFFSIIIYVMAICKSVIFDVPVIFVSRCHKPCPNETANLTDNCRVCYDCSADPPFPFSPSPQSSLFPETQQIEIRPVNNPAMASKCSIERRSHMLLTLNQKLEIIKLSEEGMLKAEIG